MPILFLLLLSPCVTEEIELLSLLLSIMSLYVDVSGRREEEGFSPMSCVEAEDPTELEYKLIFDCPISPKY